MAPTTGNNHTTENCRMRTCHTICLSCGTHFDEERSSCSVCTANAGDRGIFVYGCTLMRDKGCGYDMGLGIGHKWQDTGTSRADSIGEWEWHEVCPPCSELAGNVIDRWVRSHLERWARQRLENYPMGASPSTRDEDAADQFAVAWAMGENLPETLKTKADRITELCFAQREHRP